MSTRGSAADDLGRHDEDTGPPRSLVNRLFGRGAGSRSEASRFEQRSMYIHDQDAAKHGSARLSKEDIQGLFSEFGSNKSCIFLYLRSWFTRFHLGTSI